MTAQPPADLRQLSVVMPCFNEEATVLIIAELVLASPYTAELIVIDDASTDGTVALVERLTDPRVRLLRQELGPTARVPHLGSRSADQQSASGFQILRRKALGEPPVDS